MPPRSSVEGRLILPDRATAPKCDQMICVLKKALDATLTMGAARRVDARQDRAETWLFLGRSNPSRPAWVSSKVFPRPLVRVAGSGSAR